MIVIVEDDNSIQELLKYALEANNYKVKIFSGSEGVLEFLNKEDVSILLLDIMLPGESGIEILRKIRNIEYLENLYIIMLTAKNEEYSKVVALDNGADDYIIKPFSVLELLSRIKAALRRLKKEEKNNEKIYYKNLHINKTSRTVKLEGKKIELTLKEYTLLLLLLENKGKALSRDYLFEKIWGYDFQGESRTLDVHIRSLRSKLASISENIETIRGIGFRVRATDD